VSSSIVLISDPRVLAVPIADNDDTVVDLYDFPAICIDRRLANESNSFHRVRLSVAEKLVKAAGSLPSDLRFLVIEGHRALAQQKKHFTDYSTELKKLNPDWGAERIYNEASKYIAPPEIVPPHSTGGALDITLVDASGKELDMGTELNATPVECENACFTYSEHISAEAKRNRGILIKALSGVGFINYPTEWWHWSYGDRYWAFVTRQTAALFGPIK
jgi:D-alanyl-D-alanine dipeptidase